MPKLLGLEPDKWKPIALIGGGGLVLFLFLKSRQPTPIAADVPSGAPQQGVSSVAVQPELSASGQTATALQGLLQGQDTAQQTAMSNLALQSQEQQLQFTGQQNQLQLQSERLALQNQTELNYDAQKIGHEQVRNAQGRNTTFFQNILNQASQAAAAIGTFTTGVNAASGAAQAIQNFGVPQQQSPQQKVQQVPVLPSAVPFYPTPTGRAPGQ